MAELPSKRRLVRGIVKRAVPFASAAEAGVSAYNFLQDQLTQEPLTARPGDVDIQGLQRSGMQTKKGDIATTVSMKKLEKYKEGWLKRQEGLEVSQDRLGEMAVKKLRSDRQKMRRRQLVVGDLITTGWGLSNLLELRPKEIDKLRKEYSDLEQMIARNMAIETHSISGTEKTQGRDLVEFLRKSQLFEKGLKKRE